MRRRALLASIAGLSAGCQGFSPDGSGEPTTTATVPEPTSTNVRSPTATPTCAGNETPTVIEGDFRIADLTTSTNSEQQSPIQFDATVPDALVSAGDPGAVELALGNVGETTQQVFSGTVPPFGMVFAELTGCDERFLLWRDYQSEGCIDYADGEWLVCDIGVYTTLTPGERIGRRYEVLPVETSTYPAHTVPPGFGRYAFEKELPYHADEDEPQSTLRATVEFELEAVTE